MRYCAAVALGKVGVTTKDAIPLLLAALKDDKDAAVRQAAAFALGMIEADAKDAVPGFIVALKDVGDRKDEGIVEKYHARIYSAPQSLIIRPKGLQDPELFRELFSYNVAGARATAAYALGEIGPDAAGAEVLDARFVSSFPSPR